MKKFFVVLCVCFELFHTKAQDINYNYLPFAEKEDTVQVSWGLRFGAMHLTEPKTPKNSSYGREGLVPNKPKRIGVGNFILDMRVRFLRDSVSSSDGAFGLNLSLLRSRAFLGYQYSRKEWYSSVRFGYEVYRKEGGEMRANTKLFSRNIPMIGFEFGYLPRFLDQTFRFRSLVEYDFGNLGWYSSGTLTAKVLGWSGNRFEVGTHFDGIYGYGLFTSILLRNTLVYVSTFEGQILFQETRFPEQGIGMEKGFSFGVQTSIN